MNVYYSLAPGLSFEPLPDGSVVVYMPSRQLKLEGPSVPFILNELIPLLSGETDLDFLKEKLKNAVPEYLSESLPKLETAGIIFRSGHKAEKTKSIEDGKMMSNEQKEIFPSLINSRHHYSFEQLILLTNRAGTAPLYETLMHAQTGFIKNWTLIKKDAGEPEIPFVITVQFNYPSGEETHDGFCSGKGITLRQAEISAAGEAAERYNACSYSEEELVYSSFKNVKEKALDPRKLILYLPEQYPNITFQPFEEDAVIGWVNAYSLVNNKPLLVPALQIFLHYRLQNEKENFAEMQSSGLAAGSTLTNAIVSGALELIERDAFMCAWYNCLSCQRVDVRTHPSADIIELYSNYQKQGVDLHLFKLPTDAPCHVFMAIAIGGLHNGPYISVGLGSDFSSTKASYSALLELAQVRASSDNYYNQPDTRQRIKELASHPELVENLEDHRLLYAASDHRAAFDFLLNASSTSFTWDNSQNEEADLALTELINYVKKVGSDLVYYNLGTSITEKAGYFSCRVLLPGFQPIHFGYKNMRLASHRLYELPVQLGYAKKPSSPGSLNPYPHPLA